MHAQLPGQMGGQQLGFERGGRYLFQTAPDCANVLERARDAEKWRLRQAEQLLSEYRRTQKRSRS